MQCSRLSTDWLYFGGAVSKGHYTTVPLLRYSNTELNSGASSDLTDYSTKGNADCDC